MYICKSSRQIENLLLLFFLLLGSQISQNIQSNLYIYQYHEEFRILKITDVLYRLDNRHIHAEGDVYMMDEHYSFVILQQREQIFFVCLFWRESMAPAHCASSPERSGNSRLNSL